MIAEVIVDVMSSSVDRVFDYNVPSDMKIESGDRVLVSFAGRCIEGFVINTKKDASCDKTKLKDITKKLDAQPMLTKTMLRLCFFMKQKFYLRLIDTIRLCIPPLVRNGKIKAKTQDFLSLKLKDIDETEFSRSKKQLEVIRYLKEKPEEKKDVLSKLFGASAIKSLVKKGFLVLTTKEVDLKPIEAKLTIPKKNIVLNVQQQKAVDMISNSKYNSFLLHGVTGSGKTEVYIEVIRRALESGKTAIMLVPEISLTPQMFSRFKNAFGDNVAILHSGLSPREKFDEWNRLKTKQARIAIGARSCIFAPLTDVGVIVVDEEHDSSYYSESNPRFHTHEVARYLAYLNDCPIIFGSATPSIESYNYAKTGEYKLVQLTNRANNKELPAIEIVDMLGELYEGNSGVFSNRLLSALKECIDNKKQAMLFINRRGFSSFLMCRECGYVPKCEDCDVSLVYHKEDEMLKCHYCNRRYRVPEVCPKCKSKSIRYGAVGTQRVVEELKKIFDVPVFRLDNDTTQNKNSYINILEEFNNTSPAILVGTQMIAKGHDFNNVTLVGIINADMSLHFSDYKAVEKTFQLITQVSGRAGRSDSEGRVILQTYYPKHYVYRCATNYDYGTFFKKELNLREVSHFPPFAEILRILVVGEEEQKVMDALKSIYDKTKELQQQYSSDFVYLGAMKCPKKRLQKNYRYQVLMRIHKKNEDKIVSKIYEICDNIKKNKVSVFVELDPQNLS